MDEKPGLPKALTPIRKYFDYLLRKQYKYGYAVFFNINICRNNMEDVKQLTEIAHDNGIATDYHINESPMIEQDHFKHYDENSTFITKKDWLKGDAPDVIAINAHGDLRRPRHDIGRPDGDQDLVWAGVAFVENLRAAHVREDLSADQP